MTIVFLNCTALGLAKVHLFSGEHRKERTTGSHTLPLQETLKNMGLVVPDQADWLVLPPPLRI